MALPQSHPSSGRAISRVALGVGVGAVAFLLMGFLELRSQYSRAGLKIDWLNQPAEVVGATIPWLESAAIGIVAVAAVALVATGRGNRQGWIAPAVMAVILLALSTWFLINGVDPFGPEPVSMGDYDPLRTWQQAVQEWANAAAWSSSPFILAGFGLVQSAAALWREE